MSVDAQLSDLVGQAVLFVGTDKKEISFIPNKGVRNMSAARGSEDPSRRKEGGLAINNTLLECTITTAGLSCPYHIIDGFRLIRAQNSVGWKEFSSSPSHLPEMPVYTVGYIYDGTLEKNEIKRRS